MTLLSELLKIRDKIDSICKSLEKDQNQSSACKNLKINQESIYQQYMLEKKNHRPVNYTYHEVSTRVSSILKEAGIPLSNKQIQVQLLKKYGIQLKLENLTKNILPRLCEDSQYHVNKASRGFWQYRVT